MGLMRRLRFHAAANTVAQDLIELNAGPDDFVKVCKCDLTPLARLEAEIVKHYLLCKAVMMGTTDEDVRRELIQSIRLNINDSLRTLAKQNGMKAAQLNATIALRFKQFDQKLMDSRFANDWHFKVSEVFYSTISGDTAQFAVYAVPLGILALTILNESTELIRCAFPDGV